MVAEFVEKEEGAEYIRRFYFLVLSINNHTQLVQYVDPMSKNITRSPPSGVQW